MIILIYYILLLHVTFWKDPSLIHTLWDPLNVFIYMWDFFPNKIWIHNLMLNLFGWYLFGLEPWMVWILNLNMSSCLERSQREKGERGGEERANDSTLKQWFSTFYTGYSLIPLAVFGSLSHTIQVELPSISFLVSILDSHSTSGRDILNECFRLIWIVCWNTF